MGLQVSVVIPARNDAGGLPEAVASALDQQGADIVEILVCVGPSHDDTALVAAELAATHDRVRMLENAAGGIGSALNIGLAEASGQVLVRVDARCRLPQDYVARALSTMHAHGAANVGAMQLPVGRTRMQRAIAAAMRDRIGSGGASYRVPLVGNSPVDPEPADTAFLGVYRIDALRRIGGWDETFDRNEDAELNRRLLDHSAAGESPFEIWLDPALVVEYLPRTSLRGLARQYFDYGWWRRRMIGRHRQISSRQLAAPLIVVAVAGSTIGAAAASPIFAALPVGYLAALVGNAALLNARRREPAPLGEALLVAPAQATMHLAWGIGFLVSLVRGPRRVPPFVSSLRPK